MESPKQIFVNIARKELGVTEVTKNQSTAINRYWAYTSYVDGWKNREPWCAAFMCYVISEGMKKNPILKTDSLPMYAACRDWIKWASNNFCLVLDNEEDPQLGDIVLFTFGKDHPSHIGLVTDFDGKTVYTIEGNTNKAGSREGDGVYEKERSIQSCYKFIRTPVKALSI